MQFLFFVLIKYGRQSADSRQQPDELTPQSLHCLLSSVENVNLACVRSVQFISFSHLNTLLCLPATEPAAGGVFVRRSS
jgi:hypothetical protein